MRGAPVMSASTSLHWPVAVTRCVVPLIVRSPSTVSAPSSARLTDVESKRISGWRSASKKSGLCRWP